MIKVPKKITVCILALTIMMAGATAKAVTLDELQVQVDVLKTQINQLISMIAAMNGTQTSSESSAAISTDTNLAGVSLTNTSANAQSNSENSATANSTGAVSTNGSNPIQTPSNMYQDTYVTSPTAGTNGCVNNEETVFTDITTKCCDGYKMTTFSDCSMAAGCKSPKQYRCIQGTYVDTTQQIDNSGRIVNTSAFNGIIRIVENGCEYTYTPGKCTIIDIAANTSGNIIASYKFRPLAANGTFSSEQKIDATLITPGCLSGKINPTVQDAKNCGIFKYSIFACYVKGLGYRSSDIGKCGAVIVQPVRFFEPICGNDRCEANEADTCPADCGSGICKAAGTTGCRAINSSIGAWQSSEMLKILAGTNGLCCPGSLCVSKFNSSTGLNSSCKDCSDPANAEDCSKAIFNLYTL